MDTAITAGLQVGVQALETLNNLLDEKEIAKTWYGENNYKDFTGKRFFPINTLNKFGHRGIRKVFRIKKDTWHKVIQNCLTDCYNWYHQIKENYEGECCWLLLYRSLPEETKRDCLERSERSLSSIGIVSSLPAARVELWGLVVLAIANGAKVCSKVASTGGFYARLDAQNFVLTIWETNTGSATAHIEPREHPIESQPLTSPEWNNLLWYGYSFGGHHHIFGWPFISQETSEPPDDLVSNLRNQELSRLVIEY
ncbi:hypothetical protein M747DRAFT_270953, partial [Aspergillus niger ATCC 13496]